MKKPTVKQTKAIKNAVENGGNVSKAMRDAGYSPQTAKNPSKLTESIAWNDLMEQHLPDTELAKVHDELLHSKKITKFIGKGDYETETSEDSPIAVKALDMAYKLKGYYAPEKKDVKISRLEDILDLCEK